MSARRSPTRPRLDGILDEESWEATPAIALSDPWDSTRTNTIARIMYDDEFLYVGLVVPLDKKLPTRDETETKRTYDSMKLDCDHIELRFDVDRDYSSWYRFGVDCQGRTSESCGEDVSWNPEWYVAVKARHRIGVSS